MGFPPKLRARAVSECYKTALLPRIETSLQNNLYYICSLSTASLEVNDCLEVVADVGIHLSCLCQEQPGTCGPCSSDVVFGPAHPRQRTSSTFLPHPNMQSLPLDVRVAIVSDSRSCAGNCGPSRLASPMQTLQNLSCPAERASLSKRHAQRPTTVRIQWQGCS